jgi:hypothetical protein
MLAYEGRINGQFSLLEDHRCCAKRKLNSQSTCKRTEIISAGLSHQIMQTWMQYVNCKTHEVGSLIFC